MLLETNELDPTAAPTPPGAVASAPKVVELPLLPAAPVTPVADAPIVKVVPLYDCQPELIHNSK
jgi:hypothetical protein